MVSYQGNGEIVGWGEMWRRVFSVFSVGETIQLSPQTFFLRVALILIVFGIIALVMGGPKCRWVALFLLLYLTIPLLATWFSALSRPIFVERYLIAALPPFYILIAVGFNSLWTARTKESGGRMLREWASRPVAVLLMLTVLVGMGVSLNHHYADPAYSKSRGWRELAATFERLSAGMTPSEVRLAENFPDPTLWYYYRGRMEHITLPPGPADAEGAAVMTDELVSSGVQRVILPLQPMPLWDPDGIAPSALQDHYTSIGEMSVGVWPVHIFERFDQQQASTVDATFANALALRKVLIRPQIVSPGGVLGVHLQWGGSSDALSDSTKTFLHLLDANASIVTQNDQLFPGSDSDSWISSYSLFLPETLPLGPYQLIVGLYDPSQPDSPRLLTVDGGDHIPLAELTAP